MKKTWLFRLKINSLEKFYKVFFKDKKKFDNAINITINGFFNNKNKIYKI